MINKVSKNETRQKRHLRLRQTLVGTAEKPRLNVFRSNKQIYAQIIDDNINVSPRTDTPIVDYCTGGRMHRYTQNEFFKLIIKLIKGWADKCDKGEYDGRNEYACKLSKKLAEVIDDFILD